MGFKVVVGDCREELSKLPADSVDCCVTSPPYWALRDYGVDGQLGLEPTLGEHIDVMVDVFEHVRRVLKPEGTLWLNYGDCYATKKNGRSAAATKAAGNDDRTFRDKPLDTVGPIYGRVADGTRKPGAPYPTNASRIGGEPAVSRTGGVLKPKDLCMMPNRLAIALQEAGWWVRSEIIWAKPNPMPDSAGKYRPGTAHEKIFMLSKTGTCYYDAEAVKRPDKGADHPRKVLTKPDPSGGLMAPHSGIRTYEGRNGQGRYLRNYEPAPPQVWIIPIKGYDGAHFATFPPALVERCILAGCPPGGLVLDPFGGAGTTGLVADRHGRDAILIELNPDYTEIARNRIYDDAPLLQETAA